jgi:hypothetical protein
MHDIVVVTILLSLIASFMIPFTLKLWWKLFVLAIYVLHFSILFIFVVCITCMPQTYSYFGVTPVSLIFGNQVYDQALRELKLPDPHPRQTK